MASSTAVQSPEPTYRGLITACTVLATLMQVLDTTIANVALPYMQGTFGDAPDQITWVLTGRTRSAAIMPRQWAGCRPLRTRVVVCHVPSGFTIASMLCGLADGRSTRSCVSRLLQGAFGAAFGAAVASDDVDLYPIEQRRPRPWWLGHGRDGEVVEPTLGGYLTDAYNGVGCSSSICHVGLLGIAGLGRFP